MNFATRVRTAMPSAVLVCAAVALAVAPARTVSADPVTYVATPTVLVSQSGATTVSSASAGTKPVGR